MLSVKSSTRVDAIYIHICIYIYILYVCIYMYICLHNIKRYLNVVCEV